MTHKQFKIGEFFFCDGQKWKCTDKGKRTIVAIKIDPMATIVRRSYGKPDEITERSEDESWYDGPPYGVEEVVFDECDIEACTKEEWQDEE